MNAILLQCRFCPKSFKHKYSLRRHFKVVHSGHRPHSCSCEKSFATKEQLTRHQNAKHTLLKPFKCEKGCEKSFASYSARIYHHKMIHDNDKFRCPMLACLKQYSSQIHLRHHLMKPHDSLITLVNSISWLNDN